MGGPVHGDGRVHGTGSVSVISDSYTDASLNLGGSGSDSVTIDRTNPTVTVAIAEGSLTDGTANSLVTFTFNEAPTGFSEADLDVVGGTITGLAATVDPLVWTAQFTATDGFTGTGSVTVVSGSYTDSSLNLGGSRAAIASRSTGRTRRSPWPLLRAR